jgi:heptosyltransferase-2
VERIQLGKTLRAENYQQAILLTNTWKSALTPFFANISLRTGYVGEWRWGLLNDIRHLNKSILTQTVQRFVALGERNQATQPPVCPQPRLEVSLRQQQQVLQKYQLNIERKVLALCPGAEYGDAKRWPVEHFAQVAEYCLDRDWQVWLFGSPKDTEVAADINRRVSDQCVDLTGKTSITEAVDLLSLTDTVVSNDSGLMHVAAALNRKLIALYGSSDPEFTPPLSQDARILRLGLECSPCFQRTCPLGHKRCLVDISPQQVLTAII